MKLKKLMLRFLRKKFFLIKLRLSNILLILIFITFAYLCYIYRYLNSFDSNEESQSHKCEVTSEQRQHLFALVKQVTETLEKLGVIFFLCYLSLWGALKEAGPLPWSSNADLCILSSTFNHLDEASLFRAFQRNNLDLEYNSAEGEYTIKNSTSQNDSPLVKMILFESDIKLGGMYRRVGWKRRLLPSDCDAQPSLQCFPPHLITPPLQKKSFGPLSVPGPREDIDLLKFHYPDTWWKPLKPNC